MTHSKQFTVFSAAIGIALCLSGFACVAEAASSVGATSTTSSEDAQAALSKAYNDYYEALRKSPGFSQQDSSRLAKQILAPAHGAVEKSISAQTTRMYNDPNGAQPKILREKLGSLPSNFDPNKRGRKRGRALTLSLPRKAVGEAPEMVIDGSGVPKEIEFPGKKAEGK